MVTSVYHLQKKIKPAQKERHTALAPINTVTEKSGKRKMIFVTKTEVKMKYNE
jgi:hypothetical protein